MMTPTPHHKHPPLARPALGRFGRHEWAFLGTTCSGIQTLAGQVMSALQDEWTCAYVDADHADAPATARQVSGATLEYTAEPRGQRLRWAGEPHALHLRSLLNAADLILVNGNHHEAAAQVLVADPAKEASLRKRATQLTDVQLILLPQADSLLPAFVEELVPSASSLPRLCMHDAEGVAQFFRENMRRRAAPLYGLVLAGGHSLRMGRDKGSIAWHGRPQWAYVADMLQPLCQEVLISCRPEQAADFAPYPTLPDSFTGLGPYGALLSAFRQKPDAAWLVLACDLPLLDAATLDFLSAHRHPGRFATTFQSPHDGWPEPLLCIWEPKAYAPLLAFLAQGYSCPRKVLMQHPVHLLAPPDPAALSNVNTPEEAAALGLGKHIGIRSNWLA